MYGEPDGPIRVAVMDDFSMGGVAITMGLRHSQQEMLVLRITEEGNRSSND